jgi:hypothetical protein
MAKGLFSNPTKRFPSLNLFNASVTTIIAMFWMSLENNSVKTALVVGAFEIKNQLENVSRVLVQPFVGLGCLFKGVNVGDQLT